MNGKQIALLSVIVAALLSVAGWNMLAQIDHGDRIAAIEAIVNIEARLDRIERTMVMIEQRLQILDE